MNGGPAEVISLRHKVDESASSVLLRVICSKHDQLVVNIMIGPCIRLKCNCTINIQI